MSRPAFILSLILGLLFATISVMVSIVAQKPLIDILKIALIVEILLMPGLVIAIQELE
jgi:hypothetical protein